MAGETISRGFPLLHPTFRSIPSMQSKLIRWSNVSLFGNAYEVNILLGFLPSAFLFNSMIRERGCQSTRKWMVAEGVLSLG